MEQTLATVLAKFAAETTHAAIPAKVRKAALWHIVDTIGVCIAGANPQEESGQAARRLAEKWQSAIRRRRSSVSMPTAARRWRRC